MKMAFESSGRRFYDDGTWITPTPDGGISDAGEWRIDGADTIEVNKKEGWGKTVTWTMHADQWPELKVYLFRLERQVAAVIVGGGNGGNY